MISGNGDYSGGPTQQHTPNVPYRFCGIQPLGTHVHAVLNPVAAKYAEGIV